MEIKDKDKRKLKIGIHCKQGATTVLTFYARFIIINKTEMSLIFFREKQVNRDILPGQLTQQLPEVVLGSSPKQQIGVAFAKVYAIGIKPLAVGVKSFIDLSGKK